MLCRSQWPRGLRRRPSAARLLRSWVRIPPGAWMFVCCECCVLSGRGLCDGLITRPEDSYRLWRVVVCDQETSQTRRLKAKTTMGCNAGKTNKQSLSAVTEFSLIFVHFLTFVQFTVKLETPLCILLINTCISKFKKKKL